MERVKRGAAQFLQRLQRVGGRAKLVATGLAVLVLIGAGPARADNPTTFKSESRDGYGRMIFEFGQMPKYRAEISNGVLVVSFDQKVELKLDLVSSNLADYVLLGRVDPNGRAARFALASQIKVHSMIAGRKLFVDLLPASWKGLPPSLPQDVVAELARKAQEMEKAKKLALDLKKAQAKKTRVHLRIARLPTFSRLVFDWNVPVATAMMRKRNVVNVEFDRKAKLDLSRLKANPPRFVQDAKLEMLENGMRVQLTIDGLADVRGFREGVNYILDITGEAERERPRPVQQVLDKQRVAPLPGTPTGSEVTYALGEPSEKPSAKTPAANKTGDSSPAAERKVSGANAKAPESGKTAPKPAAKAEAANDAPAVAGGKAKPAAEPKSEAAPKPAVAEKTAEKPAEKTASKPAAKPAPQDKPQVAASAGTASMPRSQNIIKVSLHRVGSSVKLVFPFEQTVAAAVFEQAGVVWALFESDQVLDLSELKTAAGDIFGKIDRVVSQNLQIVRLHMNGRRLVRATGDNRNWFITIGNLVLDKTRPLLLKRVLREDGGSKMEILLPGARKVHWIDNRLLGRKMAVVTARGPTRGVIKTQKFVEFTAPKTVHGVIIQPLSDHLTVRLAYDKVIINQRGGLTVSGGTVHQYVEGQKPIREVGEPGFLDFVNWSQLNAAQFNTRMKALTLAAGDEDPEKRIKARLDQARFLLGRMFGAEALGVLKIAADEQKGLVKDPVFNMMRAVAALMAGRNDIARRDLKVHGLAQDHHAALWRGVLAVRDKDWATASKEFAKGSDVMNKYPIAVQGLFRREWARMALGRFDPETAALQLEAFPPGLDRETEADLSLMRGELAEMNGRTSEAFDFFAKAVRSDVAPVVAKARLKLVELKLQNNRINTTDAKKELESLAFAWRGDELELKVLRLLANLYKDGREYRRAFETMKMAVKHYADHEDAKILSSDMETLFKDLYLKGDADNMDPLEALALFYDFRALTPPGHLGDDMIRKLAERLIKVDLLEQAAEILNHQINNRLSGAARAEVAGRLAYVLLMDQKPNEALRVLRQTRQSVLPKSIARKRDVLEARALAELGKTRQAIELLSAMTGPEVERMKAEAQWMGRNWQQAGEQIERILDGDWKKGKALTDRQRQDVLRAGICFALAGDSLGQERLRGKFSDEMANSPDAEPFRIISETVDIKGQAFNKLAREIASRDSLGTFLEAYRRRFGAAAAAGATTRS